MVFNKRAGTAIFGDSEVTYLYLFYMFVDVISPILPVPYGFRRAHSFNGYAPVIILELAPFG